MLKNLRISQILWLGFGGVFALVILSNLINQWSNTSSIKSFDKVVLAYKINQELEGLYKDLVEAETGQRGFLYTGKESFLEPYNKATTRLDTDLVNLKTDIQAPEQKQRLTRVEEVIQRRMSYLAETISLQKAGKDKEVKDKVTSGAGQQIMDDLRAKLAEMIQAENQILVDRNNAATQARNFSTYFSWGSTLLVIGVGLFISSAIVRLITRSLAIAVEAAEQVSVGNLTTEIEVTSNDEIGKLLAAFRIMTQNLNSLVRQVQQSGIQITASATQIAASGKQLEATMTEQAASTNEVAATAKEIAATSSGLVKTMDEVEYKSQVTAQAAGESQQDLMHMEKTMRMLADATSIISAKLGVISEKANNINSIVTTITKVADQTNLLSLNAAIEAEKGGEYGTGFAVVAREIRRLADQTAVATLDIENMVKEMQSAVSTGVMEMDKFTKEVERGVEDVQNIGMKLESIIEKVQSINPRFQQVSNSVEAQSQGAVQISEAMVQLSEASSQTSLSLREINGAIAQLNEAAQGLRHEVSRFKVANSY